VIVMLSRGRVIRKASTPLNYVISTTATSLAHNQQQRIYSSLHRTTDCVKSWNICKARTLPNKQSPRSIHAIKAPELRIHNMADVERVLAGKYPAKVHAKRVIEWMRKRNPNVSGVLYLEGQKTRMIEDNDETVPFRYFPSFASLHDPLLTVLFQATSILLLPHRLLSSRLVLYIRHRDRNLYPLYPIYRT
jgi:hypothetical protein